MPRLPYIYPEIGESEIADTIRKRRPNGVLIGLDGVLLNAPAIASGFSQLLGAVRSSGLQPSLRELLILRVAALNRVVYEWMGHVPFAREAGLTDEQIAWIRDISNVCSSTTFEDRPRPPDFFPVAMKAALQYADCVTVDVRVTPAVFSNLKDHFNDKEVMEVTATIASYNMVSRILIALDVEDLADRSPEEF